MLKDIVLEETIVVGCFSFDAKLQNKQNLYIILEHEEAKIQLLKCSSSSYTVELLKVHLPLLSPLKTKILVTLSPSSSMIFSKNSLYVYKFSTSGSPLQQFKYKLTKPRHTILLFFNNYGTRLGFYFKDRMRVASPLKQTFALDPKERRFP